MNEETNERTKWWCMSNTRERESERLIMSYVEMLYHLSLLILVVVHVEHERERD